jgi:hypothetical protein
MDTEMDIDLPDIVAELAAASARYEASITENDIDTTDELFWDSPLTLRFGPNGVLLGHGAISAFRRGRAITGQVRSHKSIRIHTFGRDHGVVNIETRPAGRAVTMQQSQSWVRFPEGWRIVAAHVSDVADPTPAA